MTTGRDIAGSGRQSGADETAIGVFDKTNRPDALRSCPGGTAGTTSGAGNTAKSSLESIPIPPSQYRKHKSTRFQDGYLQTGFVAVWSRTAGEEQPYAKTRCRVAPVAALPADHLIRYLTETSNTVTAGAAKAQVAKKCAV